MHEVQNTVSRMLIALKGEGRKTFFCRSCFYFFFGDFSVAVFLVLRRGSSLSAGVRGVLIVLDRVLVVGLSRVCAEKSFWNNLSCLSLRISDETDRFMFGSKNDQCIVPYQFDIVVQ